MFRLHEKNIAKYFVLLSWNNPLMLKGLKSVDLKIIQMYHFRLKWKRYTVWTNWWDSNFLGVGLLLFPMGLLLFARWESWTPVFKILVRALVCKRQFYVIHSIWITGYSPLMNTLWEYPFLSTPIQTSPVNKRLRNFGPIQFIAKSSSMYRKICLGHT